MKCKRCSKEAFCVDDLCEKCSADVYWASRPLKAESVPTFEAGDRVIWYDHRLWGPRDIGNNDHCRKPGTVVGIGRDALGQTIDILFDHNPNVSHGHFAYHPYLDTAPSHVKETT